MYTFDDVMNYSAGNHDVYEAIKANIESIVPFIGAGMSMFAYPGWGAALNELADRITKKADREKAKELIKTDYMAAAEKIQASMSEDNFYDSLAEIFSSGKLNPSVLSKKKTPLEKQGVYMLPYLFNGMVMTTNFERTLEKVYEHRGRGFGGNARPGDNSVLEGWLKADKKSSLLFKIHGSLEGGVIRREDFVFTEEQYDKFYKPDSDLVKNLTQCLSNRSMLFMGASLQQDRVVTLLENISDESKWHYAFVNCSDAESATKEAECESRREELKERKISAILYDSKRQESVRIILEKLLEDINNDAYQDLKYHVGALVRKKSENPFLYNAEVIEMYGREDELEMLESFLENDKRTSFRWWAIVGPGGSGKSRLAYEFKKNLPDGWNGKYIRDYDNLPRSVTEKTLFIADYVQQHAKELGKWMALLNRSYEGSVPIRVLLIERDANKERGFSSWVDMLYEGASEVGTTDSFKAAGFGEFKHLTPLGDNSILEVIDEFTEYMQETEKIGLGRDMEAGRTKILDRLKKIDEGLCRPLFALYMTEAYLRDKDALHWNREKVLKNFVDRENKRLMNNLKHASGIGVMNTVTKACKFIKCAATLCQNLTFKEVQSLFPNEWQTIEENVKGIDPDDLMEMAGFSKNGVIEAMRPDIMGEYLVLDWFLNEPEEETRLQLLKGVWQKPEDAFTVFDRIIADYSELLSKEPELLERLIPDGFAPDSDIARVVFAMVLVNLTARQTTAKEIEKTVKKLASLNKAYPKTETTVDKLGSLNKSYPENEEIAVQYAMGLFNLTPRQTTAAEIEKTVEKLDSLNKAYPKNEEIAVQYAMGLFNLTCVQTTAAEREKTIEKLASLNESYPENEEIAVRYAKGLGNLSGMQELDTAEDTFSEIKHLASKYPDSNEMQEVLDVMQKIMEDRRQIGE